MPIDESSGWEKTKNYEAARSCYTLLAVMRGWISRARISCMTIPEGCVYNSYIHAMNDVHV